MTASWAGVCCSEPPCVAISLRRATQTFQNLMRTKAFTLSVPSNQFAKEADYFGMVSGRKKDKFKETKLMAVPGELVKAPFVGEFSLVAECRVVHTFELGLHTQFVGEILDVKADEDILSKDGLPDMEKLAPFLYSAVDQEYYFTGSKLGGAFDIGTTRPENKPPTF